jgi:hypothetical protein
MWIAIAIGVGIRPLAHGAGPSCSICSPAISAIWHMPKRDRPTGVSTFDDGPNPDNAGSLDVLGERAGHATFF